MSQSGIGGGTADWFELTNFGSGAVDITGYKFDDGSFNLAAAVSLQGVTSIAAGQSVVCLETAVASPSDAIAAFRTFWGNIDSVVIGSYSGSGISFSSGGDGVSLFDAGGSEVTRNSFGAATTGSSFGFDPTTSTFGAVSANGSFGAFTSASSTANVGSPGIIPEPSTYAALVGRSGPRRCGPAPPPRLNRRSLPRRISAGSSRAGFFASTRSALHSFGNNSASRSSRSTSRAISSTAARTVAGAARSTPAFFSRSIGWSLPPLRGSSR